MTVAQTSTGEAAPEPAAWPTARRARELDGLTIARVRDLHSLAALREEWDELLAASSSPSFFLTWEWIYSWMETAGADFAPELITARRAGRLVAVAPLARPPRMPALAGTTLGRAAEGLLFSPSLCFMGSGLAGADDLDLIVRRGEETAALAAIADSLDREQDMLELCRVPAADSRVAEVAERLVERGWTLRRKTTDVCPEIDLEGASWDDFLARLGKSHRQNVRRRLRKLEDAFEVELERVDRLEQVAPALRTLVDLHLARWEEKGESDAFGAEQIELHHAVARRCFERGWLRLYVLRLDGAPAAALYGFRYRDRFLYYQSGFDPAFASHSVGLVLMALTIRAAIEEGARCFDMLHGDEAYKFHWAGAWRELERLELYPPSRLELRRRLRDGARSAQRLLGRGDDGFSLPEEVEQ